MGGPRVGGHHARRVVVVSRLIRIRITGLREEPYTDPVHGTTRRRHPNHVATIGVLFHHSDVGLLGAKRVVDAATSPADETNPVRDPVVEVAPVALAKLDRLGTRYAVLP